MGESYSRGERIVTRRLGRVGLGLLLLAAGAAAAWAHVGRSTGYASITISRGTVRYTLTLPTSALPSDMAEALRLTQTGSQQNREKLVDTIRTRVVLHANGTRCQPGPGQVLPSAFDATSFTMLVDFACGGTVRELAVQDNIFDVLGPDHHTLAKIEAPSSTQQFVFASDSRQARFVVGDLAPGPSLRQGGFLRLGVEHILTGYDHLLFLAALLLPGGRLVTLLKIITAFTAAHSITLALAVLGVVTIPGRLVECVIAASIVWVALENVLLARAPSRRWLVSFLFGLVHGFGFASTLTTLDLPSRNLALALLGFNLGVEAGQALVVALLLPLLLWIRRWQWEPRLVRAASLTVAAVGFAWFVERLFFV